MQKPKTTSATSSDQLDRFREAARQLECDDDEAAFNAKLKKVAKAKTPEKTKGGAGEGT